MSDRLEEFRRATYALPQTNLMWPLYGAGLENLGKDGQMIAPAMPTFGYACPW